MRSVVCTALLAIVPAGCQRWNWRGEGYSDEVNALTADLRPAADEKKLSGVDARARDIERSLGVR